MSCICCIYKKVTVCKCLITPWSHEINVAYSGQLLMGVLLFCGTTKIANNVSLKINKHELSEMLWFLWQPICASIEWGMPLKLLMSQQELIIKF